MGVTLLLGLSFVAGKRLADSGMGIDVQHYRDLRREVPELREQMLALKRQLTTAQIRHEVDRSALELVRRELAKQEQQIADLTEGLRFYRSLMAPGEIAQGVTLQELELVRGSRPGRYAYRLVAQQEARRHQTVRGRLEITVLGRRQGEAVRYTLAELAGNVDGDSVPLRFRYFQAIEGELTIPEGFEPEAVEVLARVKSPSKLELRERYPWRLQEKFTHVGT